MEEVLAAATVVASMSVTVAMVIKDSVNRAFETTLTEGVRYERRYFHAAFGTAGAERGHVGLPRQTAHRISTGVTPCGWGCAPGHRGSCFFVLLGSNRHANVASLWCVHTLA